MLLILDYTDCEHEFLSHKYGGHTVYQYLYTRLRSQDVEFMDINAEHFIEKLYCTTRDKLFRYAYRLIGRVEKAEELVQEVFVLAMLHKEELLSHANPQGWLFVTLKYQILNERRRKESISEVPLDDFFALEEKPPCEPLETILPRELADLEKQILIWRFEDQIDYYEMSNRLGISQNACRIRVSRAVEKCRKNWDKNF